MGVAGRVRAVTVACVSFVMGAGCGRSSTSPSPTCRRFATAVSRTDSPSAVETCSWRPPTYGCYGGSWSYHDTADFVDEAQTPNRILAVSRTQYLPGSPGLWRYGGSSQGTTNYSYDPNRRLLLIQSGADTIAFDSWDSLERPVAGTRTNVGGTTRVTITYDDAARVMVVSTGEVVQQDRDGNITRDGSMEWSVRTTDVVCK